MNFTIEKKGYSTYEVDSYVEDLEKRCQTLQSKNSELEQKLATAKRLIRRFSDTENALKQSIADSKRAAAYMISDAKERSDALLDGARESCGEIISELDMLIADRMRTVSLMKAEVSAFKDELFALYSTHIEMIDTLADRAESFEYQPDYSAVAEAVDVFEEKGEPSCDAPEFVDYPEESIFAELEEAEAAEASSAAEGFVMEAPEDAGAQYETAEDAADEAESFEPMDPAPAEDDDAEPVDFDDSLTFAESAEGEDAAGDDEGEHHVFRMLDGGDAADLAEEAPAADEAADAADATEEAAESEEKPADKSAENDYFKFLMDFANSDE